MKQNISKAAKANGLTASVAHNRIKAGWSEADAVSVPTRRYKSKKKSKAEAVWAYLLENPLATYVEVAKETGVSYSYAYALKTKISTPREVFELEAAGATTAEWKSLTPVANDDTSVGKTIGNYIRRWWKAA